MINYLGGSSREEGWSGGSEHRQEQWHGFGRDIKPTEKR